ncbi:MAG: hypothetical protein HY337_06210 [Gemmatimonadetes bacterium]|nr:hypothetical protein [Gemmatimonadota bacterium]
MRRALVLVLTLGSNAASLAAQAVPERSQAARVEPAYRRTPTFRLDPFRHAMIPHWGFVVSAGAMGENNSVNFADARALIYLQDQDSLLPSDILNTINLVPEGRGLTGVAQGEGGFYLGGPFGGHFGFGLSARGRGYGAFHLDDNFVALIRDGTGSQPSFSLGSSRGTALATAEGGAHAVLRLGPLGSEDGVHLNLGFGGRYIKPVYFARAGSTVASGDEIRITNDSIIIDLEVEVAHTPEVDSTLNGKAGIATDFLLRLTWPTSGFALEAMVANIGKLTIHNVEVETRRLRVRTNSIEDVADSLDSFDSLAVTDTTDLRITLPRIVRFMASAWANRFLQVDLSATLPVKGDFESPLAVDVGTTWRLIRVLPLRAGVVLGGHQGVGFTGGFALEGRNSFLQVSGQSFGGFMRKATGVGGRFELGFFF